MSPPGVTVIDIRSLSFTGTSWFNTILGSHPEALTLGSPDRFSRLWQTSPQELCLVHGANCKFWPEFCRIYDPSQGFFRQLAAFSGRRVFVINNPIPNEFGRELECPEVNVVRCYLVRDGRAVAASYARHMNVSFAEAISNWYQPGIESFLAAFPIKAECLFRYEELVSNLDAALKYVGDPANIDYGSEISRYWEYDHHLIQANRGFMSSFMFHRGQPVGDITARSFYEQQARNEDRQPRSGFQDDRWRGELSGTDLALFESICGMSNRKLGYGADGQLLPPRLDTVSQDKSGPIYRESVNWARAIAHKILQWCC